LSYFASRQTFSDHNRGISADFVKWGIVHYTSAINSSDPYRRDMRRRGEYVKEKAYTWLKVKRKSTEQRGEAKTHTTHKSLR